MMLGIRTPREIDEESGIVQEVKLSLNDACEIIIAIIMWYG